MGIGQTLLQSQILLGAMCQGATTFSMAVYDPHSVTPLWIDPRKTYDQTWKWWILGAPLHGTHWDGRNIFDLNLLSYPFQLLRIKGVHKYRSYEENE